MLWPAAPTARKPDSPTQGFPGGESLATTAVRSVCSSTRQTSTGGAHEPPGPTENMLPDSGTSQVPSCSSGDTFRSSPFALKCPTCDVNGALLDELAGGARRGGARRGGARRVAEVQEEKRAAGRTRVRRPTRTCPGTPTVRLAPLLTSMRRKSAPEPAPPASQT